VKIDLSCIKCGTLLRREQHRETFRIKHGQSGPYCSGSCTNRHDDPRTTKEPDPIPGAKWLRLTRGKFALVDEDVFDELSRRIWHWQKDGKSSGHVVSGSTSLHRVVLGVSSARVFIDHKNNNGLDCRLENLRVARRRDNGANRGKFVGRPGRKFTSRYKGVTDQSKHLAREYVRNIKKKAIDRPWVARIRVDHKLIQLGRFASELEAALAYDAAALQHFGEFARPNFPVEAHPS
jgi:hypothetical protein